MIQYFFQDFPQIIAGITTQEYGNCSNTLIREGEASIFHQRLLSMHHMSDINIGKLIHTDIIINIGKDDLSKESDALISNISNKFIGVTTADCIPVFLFDSRTNAVGIVHSGRKGLFLEITNKTIIKMNHDFGTNTSDLYIQIGPHICEKCYEVDNFILEEFGIFEKKTKGYLPMQEILLSQLEKLHIPKNQIFTSPLCTRCSQNRDQYIFYSHRRQESERMLSFIGIV